RCSAALAALLVSAAAALTLLLLLLLPRFIAQGALLAHGLGQFVDALLHRLIAFAFLTFALAALAQLHIEIGQDLGQLLQQLLRFRIAALLAQFLNAPEHLLNVALGERGLILGVVEVLCGFAVAQRFLHQSLHVVLGRAAQRFEQLPDAFPRRSLSQRLGQLALCFFERTPRVGCAAILSAQRGAPQGVGGDVCFLGIAGDGELRARR